MNLEAGLRTKHKTLPPGVRVFFHKVKMNICLGAMTSDDEKRGSYIRVLREEYANFG